MLDIMNRWEPGTAGRLTLKQLKQYFRASCLFASDKPNEYLAEDEPEEDSSPNMYSAPTNDEMSRATRKILDLGNTPSIILVVSEAIKDRIRANSKNGLCDAALYNEIMSKLGYG